MGVVNDDGLARRIWEWLPARTDSRRVTLPGVIAAHFAVTTRVVAETLAEMEAGGYAIRDRAIGSGGWHRGKPYPGPEQPVEEALSLF